MKRVGAAPHACERSQGNLEPTFNRAVAPVTRSIQVMGLTLSGGLNEIIQCVQVRSGAARLHRTQKGCALLGRLTKTL